MAVKLDLRSRAIISFGDFADVVSENDIRKRMQEIAAEDPDYEEEKPQVSKRGRKPTMIGGKTLSVWLDDESISMAKRMASARGISLSSFFRSMIRDAATPKIPQPNISTVGRRI